MSLALNLLASVALVTQTWAFSEGGGPIIDTIPSPITDGDPVTSVTFKFTLASGGAGIDSGNFVTITETNAATIFLALPGGATNPTQVVLTKDPDGTPVSVGAGDATVITTASSVTIQGSGTPAVQMNAGDVISLQVKSTALAVGTAAGTNIEFDFASTDSVDDVANVLGWNPSPSSGGAGSDPITWLGGKRIKFWIPAETYTPLLESPEVSILAQPLLGPKDMQWFDRMRLALPDGKLLAEIGTVQEGDLQEEKVDAQKMIGEQLKVKLGEGLQVNHYKEATLFSTRDGKVKGAVYKRPYHLARTHGKNEVEYLYIETPSIAFGIYSSHAGNEFHEDIALQTKYKHLDFMIASSTLPWNEYKGVLPELWEVIPRSAAVQAMTISPMDKAICES